MPSGRSKKTEELKFDGIHQFLVHADDVNVSGGNINVTKKTQELY
jgi:hypothetical protein